MKKNGFSYIKIQSIEIPSTVIDIKDYGFGYIYSLKSITFKEGSKLQSLSNNVFISARFVEFKVPESVQYIIGACLNDVATLTIIRVHQNNKYFVSDNYAVYTKDYTQILVFAANSNSTYNINPKVTFINHGAFMGAKCTSITIPQSVKVIGTYAFAVTLNLKQITLPPNITTVSMGCFTYSGLTSIDIPEKVTKIETDAFAGCGSLKSILLPGNLNEVGGNAFPPNPNINFTFKGDSQIKIDSQMLIMAKDNSSISLLLDPSATSIKIPSQVKRIKSSSFKNKKSLISIICDGTSELEVIENGAFSYCTSLTSIPYFPKLKEIGKSAFCQTKLSSQFISPASFAYLGNNAFSEVITLPSVSFSSTVSKLTIQDSAFEGYTSLRTASFDECTCDIFIGQNVFSGCTSLATFNVINRIKSIDSGSFMNSGLITITFEGSKTSFDTLPSMLFKGCSNLNEVSIPNNIISIGSECFSGTSITRVSLPDSVESLYSECFKGCTNLERVDIFSSCNLSKVFPGIFEGCTSLSYISDFTSENLVCHNSTIYSKDFGRVYLHAPACRDNYISFDRRLNSVADSAFINSAYIEIVVFVDNSVSSIGRRAFESCIRLKQISIPSSVSSIGDNAFINCISLKCGVLFQNKTQRFVDILTSSGLPKTSLVACQAFSCRPQQILNVPIPTILFTVFILM